MCIRDSNKYDNEGRVLITEHENFLLYNIYFPNGQKDDVRLKYKLDFYDDLLPLINEQVESGNNVIVTGDWNTAHKEIDLARPKENINTSGFMQIEREKIDEYISKGWIDTFRIFHNEQEVRALAFKAIKLSIEENLFELVSQFFYSSVITLNSFEEFENNVIKATHTNHDLSYDKYIKVKNKFESYKDLSRSPNYFFEVPMRVDLLRKIS